MTTGQESTSEKTAPACDTPALQTLRSGIVTISTSRSIDDDVAGDTITTLLEDNDHEVVDRRLVADDFNTIQTAIEKLLGRDDVQMVITTGGTGVTADDVTIEAVTPLLDKKLPGFGELFRQLSYDDIGTRTLLTRTTAGIANEIPIFCLPGNTDAVRLGVEELILKEAGLIAGLAKRHKRDRQA